MTIFHSLQANEFNETFHKSNKKSILARPTNIMVSLCTLTSPFSPNSEIFKPCKKIIEATFVTVLKFKQWGKRLILEPKKYGSPIITG
jgi:hypothetical protein